MNVKNDTLNSDSQTIIEELALLSAKGKAVSTLLSNPGCLEGFPSEILELNIGTLTDMFEKLELGLDQLRASPGNA